MVIVEVISSLSSRGGAQVFLISLIKKLREKHEVHLISLYDGINPSFKEEIDKNHINYSSCHKKRRIDLKAAYTLRKKLRNIQPDVINFHLSFLATYYLAFGARKQRWKLIETFHSVPGHDLTKIDNYLRKKYINKNLLSFIGISDRITIEARKQFGAINIQTIYNGIELTACEQTRVPLSRKEFDFICVANMLEVKNHALLLEAFSIFLNRFPKANLLLVGGGQLLDYNKNLSSQLGISQHVIFTGYANDVKAYYEKANFFVLASKREGNPISILEAMSFGLPIIAPSVGGIPDIVKNGHNGLLFKSGSKEELLQCLISMYTNEEMANDISKANVEESRKYSIALTCNKYIEYFNHIVASSNR